MDILKPSDEDEDFFRRLVPAAAGVEVKPMFGNLGAFVNGNMFAGLFGPARAKTPAKAAAPKPRRAPPPG